MRSIALLVVSAWLAALPVHAEVLPVTHPAAAGALAPELAESDRGAVLTWLEPDDDGHALRFAEFDGERFGTGRTIARGHDWFVNWADTPRLFIAPDGDWIAHWPVKSGRATYAYDVVAARSTDRGATWSPPVTPHRDGTQTEHGFVSYFADPDGTAHLVWLDGRHTGAATGHAGHGTGGPTRDEAEEGAMTLRTASMVGASFGPSIELDDRVCDCCQTASASTEAGPVVVYRDRSDDEVRDIHIVRRLDDGWTAPAPVAADGWVIAGCPVNGPDIAADGDRVAVAWFTMADGVPAVRLAVSIDSGASFQPAQTFSAGTALGRVQLARVDDGFLMLWMDEAEAGAVLRLARFGDRGEARWTRTVAELGAGRSSGFPRMAVVGDRILLAWTSSGTNAAGDPAPRIATALVDLESAPPG
ncbi:exo-alpha-sialidase [Wenzhouxiangella sp. XN79A]|uniref:sialidase family protein n=1 Tax=Wenzhouxiangella sp. XN79A TaxID=2724193 RepID=UPI00144A57F6|nr:sialidase family protein [Wenzhouxiangella sp. XN79A]NKI35965.1 exo-alpha-sialidase [Wenzhouxiangella sp. XN79A]